MPSMPVYFWNDADGSRYRGACFDRWPGGWRHGDWLTVTDHGGLVLSGRSDSTLNRGGVRLGSADVHAAVEGLAAVRESLVIGAELPDGGYWMPLFVVLEPGHELEDLLRKEIITALRTPASPRHVPDTVIAVPAVPHTRTGKKLEIPVKRVLQGAGVLRPLRVGGCEGPGVGAVRTPGGGDPYGTRGAAARIARSGAVLEGGQDHRVVEPDDVLLVRGSFGRVDAPASLAGLKEELPADWHELTAELQRADDEDVLYRLADRPSDLPLDRLADR